MISNTGFAIRSGLTDCRINILLRLLFILGTMMLLVIVYQAENRLEFSLLGIAIILSLQIYWLFSYMQSTQRELERAFAAHGISRIAAMGLPLDPNQHQAMMEVPTDDAEEGTIVQEMQAGYMIKDRLLRPAMVGVAKKP